MVNVFQNGANKLYYSNNSSTKCKWSNVVPKKGQNVYQNNIPKNVLNNIIFRKKVDSSCSKRY